MKKWILIGVFLGLFVAWYALDLGQYLSLEMLSQNLDTLKEQVAQNRLLASALYFFLYVIALAFSIPGALVLTIAGGVLFGFWQSLLLVSFASALGSTLAMLVSRTVLSDWVRGRFGQYLSPIDRGVEREGAFYLFGLRLVPLFPLFVINLVFGLTRMSAFRFYWVSQLGMLPGTAVYLNISAQLGEIESFSAGSVLTPEIIGSFVLVGVFPLLVSRVLNWFKKRRALKGFTKPKTFDYNLIVVGAGSGGLVAAVVASAVRSKVLLIERDKMGGDCLWRGCVPSKAILKSASIAQTVREAGNYGIETQAPVPDFAQVMRRVHDIIASIEPHDSPERYRSLGVDCLQAEAEVITPWQVRAAGEVHTARRIVIATGGEPFVPPIEGLSEAPWVTSDNFWELTELPKRLLVVGSGPIGCELSQACARLGSDVSVVSQTALPSPREAEDASRILQRALEADGVRFYSNATVQRVLVRDGQHLAVLVNEDGKESEVGFDLLLLATGRKSVSRNLGLDSVGVELELDGSIKVDENLCTTCPTIYACGDVVGPHRFTHAAAHQAWFAAVNALFDPVRFKVDYSLIPHCTYTDPEFAGVGLSEVQAQEQGVEYDLTEYSLEGLDRLITDGENKGYIRLLTVKGKDTILGVSIVGHNAGEMVGLFALAMRNKLGLSKILPVVFPYPTSMEGAKLAAGQWRRTQASESQLRLAERIMRWRRG